MAAQTAKATEEIGAQSPACRAAQEDSVAAIKEIGGTIGRIAEIAAAIAAAVERQAPPEISRNVQEAAQGTSQVATNITDVNHGASETGSASSQVLASAQSLARESGHLEERRWKSFSPRSALPEVGAGSARYQHVAELPGIARVDLPGNK